ncbi:MAG: hypothetical protein FAF04_07800, partial [Epsilonproteobacteria bacterium]|nr:hypothetical protein [Campylobacterota bacterium]
MTKNVVDTLCKELKIRNETLGRILDIPMDTINNWRLENEMPKLALKAIEFYKAGVQFKEKSSKLKMDAEELEKKLIEQQTAFELLERELNQYKK